MFELARRTWIRLRNDRPGGCVEGRFGEAIRASLQPSRKQTDVASQRTLQSGSMPGVARQHQRDWFVADRGFECAGQMLMKAHQVDLTPACSSALAGEDDPAALALAPCTVKLKRRLGELDAERVLDTRGKIRIVDDLQPFDASRVEGDSIRGEDEQPLAVGTACSTVSPTVASSRSRTRARATLRS